LLRWQFLWPLGDQRSHRMWPCWATWLTSFAARNTRNAWYHLLVRNHGS
jgi:hypothetical protein